MFISSIRCSWIDSFINKFFHWADSSQTHCPNLAAARQQLAAWTAPFFLPQDLLGAYPRSCFYWGLGRGIGPASSRMSDMRSACIALCALCSLRRSCRSCNCGRDAGRRGRGRRSNFGCYPCRDLRDPSTHGDAAIGRPEKFVSFTERKPIPTCWGHCLQF